MVVAAFAFAILGWTVKLASRELPQAMVVFLRCSLGLLVLLPWLLATRQRVPRSRHFGGHLARGLAGMGAMYCFFYAIAHLGLAEALVLNYALPLFIPIVERLWLGERIPRGIGFPLLLGLLGLLLILKPGTSIFQPVALVGALAAVLAATAQVGVRGLTRSESISSIVLYFGVISTAVSAIPAALEWVTPAFELWPSLLAMGGSATFAQLMMTRAYRDAPAARVGPFIYTSVVFGGAIDWLTFGKTPDPWTAFGSAVIVFSAIMTLRLRPRRAGRG
ncbi:MAG TPA: DMT family transporter [Polyangiaceae bacterium]